MENRIDINSLQPNTCVIFLGISSDGYAMEKTNVVLMVVTKWLHEYDSENQIAGDHDFFLFMMSL